MISESGFSADKGSYMRRSDLDLRFLASGRTTRTDGPASLKYRIVVLLASIHHVRLLPYHDIYALDVNVGVHPTFPW